MAEEDMLRMCEAKFDPILRGVMRGSPIPQFVIDKGHKVIYWNNALEKYTGITAEDVIGTDRHWKAFYRTKRPCMADLIIDGALEEVPKWYAGKYGRSPLLEGAYSATDFFPEVGDGGKWLCFTAAAIEDAGGNIIGAVETLEDVTERIVAEGQLKEAKRQAEMYVELMGHDINNMNQIGIGYLEMALQAPGLDEKTKKQVLKALETLNDSSRLIGNVQKLQRISAGEVKREPIDIGEMLDGLRARYSMAPGRAIVINYAPKRGCLVLANELLRDVFSNIIGNAIKHSSGPLEINVSIDQVLEEGRHFYRVSLEDNGPGIPPGMRPGLFTRFQRGTAHATGKGLGLYLVKSLVDSFRGKVWAEDRVPGDYTRGSRFVVLLPAIDGGPPRRS